MTILKVLLNGSLNNPPTLIDATDSFYNSQGNICATKSDLEVDSTVSEAPDKGSGKKGEGYRIKPSGNTSEEYRSKPRTEKKKKKGKWVKNKKIRWKDQMKASTFPTHLLPPKSDPTIEGVPAAVVT